MKKKYLLGSILITLQMLVSTQFFLAPNAISYSAIHYGDAYIGEMWLSELDVSSVVSEFDDIAITHVEAFNEWVAWEEGFGNITVNWSINIQSTDHPEYYVVFGFDVYNIDNDSQVIGSGTYDVTIDQNDDYVDSGAIAVFIKFTEDEMQTWDDVTLFCSLGAFIQLNDTEAAKDFTCSAADRSIVAIDFEMPMSEPNYGQYLDEANYFLPPVCSWSDGWENHYNTESDMLNEQTFFQVGNEHEESQGQGYPLGTWLWGTMYCLMQNQNWIWPLSIDWTMNQYRQGESNEKTWNEKYSIVEGVVSIGCQIAAAPGLEGSIRISGTFFGAETVIPRPLGRIRNEYGVLEFDGETWTHALGDVMAVPSEDDINDPLEKTVDMFACITLWDRLPHPRFVQDYHLHYDENTEEQETLENATIYYWEEDCVYLNSTSEALSVDSSVYLGTTIVEADITQALCEEGMPIYSFAADRGEMRVEFIC